MRRKFKTEELDFLKSFNGTKNKNELLELFNNNFEKITSTQLETLLHRYKIPFKKLPSYTFKKGHTPWNKGKKTGIRPPNLFKKGNVTWNTRELYSERIDRDGYTYIKLINKKKWKLKHRWIWEQKYGEIPADHVVIFADGNKKNFNIENLILVSRKELAVLNKNKLLQFTGTKDKAGQELYEADVILFNDGIDDIYGLISYDDDEGTYRVSYENITEHLSEREGDFEIVGNIFENPQLHEQLGY